MSNHTFQQARLSKDPRFDGTFFVAVKTTKIFCRPICPANSPLERNVEYFEHAQQAMGAGYRPCLRCRPDSAPQSFAWKGVNTTVERACLLLHQFHSLSINEIADKLGISERYFRLLFQTHLGMSPKQYQLFNKVLFAKKLLHQTALPIEDIAQASGFASARRLQGNFKKVTGLTPRDVRSGNLSQREQNIRISMAYRPPFNWPHMRDFLSVRAIKNIEQIDDLSYARSFTLNQKKGHFRAYFDERKRQFEVTIQLDDMTLFMHVVRNIERLLDVNARVETIQSQLFEAGIELDHLTDGLRLPGVWDTFEAGCRAILGQQISVKVAISLLNHLCEKLGDVVDGQLYFPSPHAIAKHSLDFLKIPNSRKQTLINFAQHVLDHPQSVPDNWLALKGVGPWTVAYANLRGLSQPDVWLGTDLVVKNRLKGKNIEPDHAKPWRSYLTFQLWNMA